MLLATDIFHALTSFFPNYAVCILYQIIEPLLYPKKQKTKIFRYFKILQDIINQKSKQPKREKMAKDHYFDISAKLDMMEMKNAVAQAQKELATRFDFKGLVADIELNEKAKTVTLSSSSEQKIDALKDILISKLIKREISGKSLHELKSEGISGGNVKFIYRIIDSLESDEAKKIVKAIKELKLKVTSSIQGDEVRVSGAKIDDLQKVMAEVRKLDLNAPLVFGNFR